MKQLRKKNKLRDGRELIKIKPFQCFDINVDHKKKISLILQRRADVLG